MNINFVVHSFDKIRLGGVLKVVTNLVNELALNKEYKISIISLSDVENPAFELSDKITLKTLGIKKFDTTFYKGAVKLFWFFQAYFKLKSYFKRDKKAIWISSSPPMTILFSLLKNKTNILFGCEHASTKFKSESLYQRLKLALYRKLDKVIALTPQDNEFYLSHHIKSLLIPNGIKRVNENESNDRSKVVFIGRFSQEKSPLQAINVFAQSALCKQGAELVLYGYGEQLADIQQRIDSLNLSASIISNETSEIRMLKNAACLIMTSKTECFPTVLLEAISHNVPCISFDCEFGPRNIINAENGYLIEMGNESAFSQKLDATELKRFWNTDIKESINAYYIENIAKEWFKLFNQYKSIQ